MKIQLAHISESNIVENISIVDTDDFISADEMFSSLKDRYNNYRESVINKFRVSDQKKEDMINAMREENIAFLHTWEECGIGWEYVPNELELPFRFRCPVMPDIERNISMEDRRSTTGRYWSRDRYAFSYEAFMMPWKEALRLVDGTDIPPDPEEIQNRIW